ncbi:MAG: metallophosphoesterase family protein [Ilumatobacteraceae bacterium]
MRIGLVSDIHGNAEALEAAIAHMGDVDELWCAGDAMSEYRFSNDVVAILRERCSQYVIGNHEYGLLSDYGERARSRADPDLLEYVRTRPKCVEQTLEGRRIMMTHASPVEPFTQYLAAGSPDLIRVADVAADVVIIGHTHMPMVQRFGSVLLVNPGSTGQSRPSDRGPVLSCAVLHLPSCEVEVTTYGERFDDVVDRRLIAA